MYLIHNGVYLCNEICSTSILFALFQALISLEDRISQCEEVQDFFSVEEDDLNPPKEDEWVKITNWNPFYHHTNGCQNNKYPSPTHSPQMHACTPMHKLIKARAFSLIYFHQPIPSKVKPFIVKLTWKKTLRLIQWCVQWWHIQSVLQLRNNIKMLFFAFFFRANTHPWKLVTNDRERKHI